MENLFRISVVEYIVRFQAFIRTFRLTHGSVIVGDEGANTNDLNLDSSTVMKVKTLHISSPILAAKSPFFYKVKVNCLCWSCFITIMHNPKTVSCSLHL